jgi:glycosyltransferase involved in cell wall biosynthesis
VTTKQKTGKIYFYVYPSAFQNVGGGEVQLLETKNHLDKLGAPVHLFDQWTDQFQPGDLLHVFGSVKEALGLMVAAKSLGAKVVLSPIIWYNWQSSLRIHYSTRDRAVCILRQLTKTLFPSFPSSRRKMMLLADLILAGSRMEADQIEKYFSIPRSKIKVIRYGVDEHFYNATRNQFVERYKLEDFVLCVGRIEPRKNQLKLIHAMKRSPRPLVLIGGAVSHHQDYYARCRREAGSNVHFLGALPPGSDLLKSAYAACSVFALPTWFETPGHAAMEAALAGAKVVVTREGSAREYFGDLVDYINPASVRDIARQIKKALKQDPSRLLSEHVRQNFTWNKTAKETLDAYALASDETE